MLSSASQFFGPTWDPIRGRKLVLGLEGCTDLQKLQLFWTVLDFFGTFLILFKNMLGREWLSQKHHEQICYQGGHIGVYLSMETISHVGEPMRAKECPGKPRSESGKQTRKQDLSQGNNHRIRVESAATILEHVVSLGNNKKLKPESGKQARNQDLSRGNRHKTNI